MRVSWVIILVALVMTWLGCIEPAGKFSALPPGPWRATLELSEAQVNTTGDAFDEKSGGMLPFNFEVIYDSTDQFYIEIHNGAERIRLDKIAFGRDMVSQKDTIRIAFPAYGSYISAKYEEDAIEGYWYAPDRGEDYRIPFKAQFGEDKRFIMIDPPAADVSGEWAVKFSVERDNPYKAVGVFDQQPDGSVEGTFKTATGDYRFLEGKMTGDRLLLSTFDGSHAYLFEAKYLEDGSLSGIFRSGNHYKTYWSAERDGDTDLPDPFAQTVVKDTAEVVEFAFPNSDGDTVRLSDPEYEGKVKLIQIMGTWCPNCRDETEFLVKYKRQHPDLDFEIIGVAFERFKDPAKALSVIKRYKEDTKVDYEILYGGTSDKADATEKLGVLERVISFPTLIFLDKDNRIARIHTGFNGPATEEYQVFLKKFDSELKQLIKG